MFDVLGRKWFCDSTRSTEIEESDDDESFSEKYTKQWSLI